MNNLSQKEKELLEYYENDEWVSVSNSDEIKKYGSPVRTMIMLFQHK